MPLHPGLPAQRGGQELSEKRRALWKRSATGLAFPPLLSPRPPLGDGPPGRAKALYPGLPAPSRAGRGVERHAAWPGLYRHGTTGATARGSGRQGLFPGAGQGGEKEPNPGVYVKTKKNARFLPAWEESGRFHLQGNRSTAGEQGGDGHKSGGGPFYQNDLTIQGKEGKQQRGMNDAGRFQILIAQGHGQ